MTQPPEHTLLNRRDPYAAFRILDFRLLFIGRFIASFGNEMVSFAVAWELWLRTHSAFALGLVGLVQVVPVILLSLPAGHAADQYDRRRILMIAQSSFVVFALGLTYLSFTQGPLFFVYLCLFGIGVARSFYDTASSTLVPETVPPHLFSSAATWTSGSWQVASILGPAVAGLFIAFVGRATFIYGIDAIGAVVFAVILSRIKGKKLPPARKSATWASLVEGFKFMRDTKIILAAITLDMFAVLFGGAVALLPIYATDILNVGAQGMGIMRAAPSIGAVLMAFAVAHLPPMKNAGRTLLLSVAGFGVFTIIFGLSNWFWLSVLMLALLGAVDNISVIIRGTLLLTQTPDAMRGRISGVNSIFIGISNELGSFESGFVAALFGPVVTVVGGGIGTILVVLAAAKYWPEIRNLKTLDIPKAQEG